MMEAARRLETVNLRKEYPGTVALRDVSLRFDGGKIHAVLGKNGAGKSTLIKILVGAVQPTSGTILINNQPAVILSPGEALARGIAAVHQELTIVPALSVAENILLGRLPKTSSGLINWRRSFEEAGEMLRRIGVSIDVRRPAGSLGIAQQQTVEIAKAMSYEPSVLMLDEPTSALAREEIGNLFTILRGLAAKGVVLLYITHRLEEISRIADTVTVLRNGESVGTIDASSATPAVIVDMMFGGSVQQSRPPERLPSDEIILEVKDFTRSGSFTDISFSLRKGEVLGIAGLLGSGRTELLRALFGADAHDSGEVYLNGNPVNPSSPAQMTRLGVVLAPEKRKEEGLVQLLSTRVNVCLASLSRISGFGFVTAGRERAVARKNVAELQIAMPSVDAAVSSLSGGNQQKVVIAKWLNTRPCVVLLDEPTRGIDIQAKQQVFQIIRDLSMQGIACIMVSSELEELMEVCHKILIMRHGTLVGALTPRESTLGELLTACMA